MSKPIYISFWQIVDSQNLFLIDKGQVPTNEYPTDVPCRIVSNYDELDIVVEISPAVYNSAIKIAIDNLNNYAYCTTYDKGRIDNPAFAKQNLKHWYITGIEIQQDLTCLVKLHRDTVKDFWTGAFYANLRDTMVVISNESEPTDNKTRNGGQKLLFTESQIEGDEINELFPYAWANNVAESAGWIHKNLFIIDIASSDADDSSASQYFFDSKAGVNTYVTDYVGLIKLCNYITTQNIFEEIAQKLTSGDAGRAILRIARSPVEFPSAALNEVEKIVVGGGYEILTAHDDVVIGEGGVNAHFYKLTRYHWTTPTNDTSGRYWKSLGQPFTFSYNVNEVERMTLSMPFADKVDLTPYIEFFEGQFTVGYVIDMLTGEGMCGVVKGGIIDCDELSGDWLTKFDVVIPINTFADIEWIEVQENELQRFINGFNLISGLNQGSLGALANLGADPTTISPHRSTDNADARRLMIYGRFMKWGVKYVLREKGVKNQGFRHSKQKLSSLPTTTAEEFPSTPYNIITVDCQKRAWTGNTAIDDDIYSILTQRGFIKNI